MFSRDEWNQKFDELDDEGRRFVLVMIEGECERVRESRRARLRLISCAQLPPNIPNNQVKPLPISGVG